MPREAARPPPQCGLLPQQRSRQPTQHQRLLHGLSLSVAQVRRYPQKLGLQMRPLQSHCRLRYSAHIFYQGGRRVGGPPRNRRPCAAPSCIAASHRQGRMLMFFSRSSCASPLTCSRPRREKSGDATWSANADSLSTVSSPIPLPSTIRPPPGSLLVSLSVQVRPRLRP